MVETRKRPETGLPEPFRESPGPAEEIYERAFAHGTHNYTGVILIQPMGEESSRTASEGGGCIRGRTWIMLAPARAKGRRGDVPLSEARCRTPSLCFSKSSTSPETGCAVAIIERDDVRIKDAILHLIDPEEGGFRPSERALPTVGESRATFLATHVAHSLSDSAVKGARFVAYSADTAPGIIQRLVRGRRFVADSQALARLAYNLMENDRRIRPPGLLAVLRYTTAGSPKLNHVAVLKLDKGGRFGWFPRADEDGTTYWDLEETANVAPAAGEPLHKAAFVGPLDATALAGLSGPRDLPGAGDDADTEPGGKPGSEEPEPDGAGSPRHQFLVLDRQVRGGADWWRSKFLLAGPAFTDRECAELWHKGALAGSNRVRDRLDRDRQVALDLAIRSGITGGRLNVNSFTDALDLPDDLKAEFREEIDQRLPDHEFEIEDEVRKKYRKATWKGDNGLSITIDAEYEEQVRADPVDDGVLVTIHTSRWHKSN